jgi:hypothetical protein
VVDLWTDTYAAPFSSTKFEVEFGGTAVAAVHTATVLPIDRASGKAHTYVPAAFEVVSLLESTAIPDMIASGNLPMVVPTVEQLAAARSGDKVDGAAMDGLGGGEFGGGDGDGDNSGGAAGETEAGGDGGGSDGAAGFHTYNASLALELLMEPKAVVLLAHRADDSGTDRIPVGTYALVTRDVRRSGGWKAGGLLHTGPALAPHCFPHWPHPEVRTLHSEHYTLNPPLHTPPHPPPSTLHPPPSTLDPRP